MEVRTKIEKRVLVIDDNKSDLVMAKFLIGKEGWNSMLLENQLKALQTVKEYVPHLILLDLEMPGLSGLELLKRLKKDVFCSKVPVIILSGSGSLVDVKAAIALGALDYIVKPLDPQIFSVKVNRHIFRAPGEAKADSKKSEWIEYDIPAEEQSDIKLFLDAKLISFGEVTFRLHCSYSLPIGTTMLMEFDALKELELGILPVQITDSTEINKNLFEIRCTLMGMAEKDLQKIRIFCKSLWKDNRAL